VRSIFAAYERGDPLASLDRAEPEMEFMIVGGPEPGTWSGLVEIEAGWRDYMSAWEVFSVEAEEYRELDDERVLVPLGSTGAARWADLGCGLCGSRRDGRRRQSSWCDHRTPASDTGPQRVKARVCRAREQHAPPLRRIAT